MIRRVLTAALVSVLPVLAVTAMTATPAAATTAASAPPAYWLAASDGGIFSFGGAPFYGSTGGTILNKPVVGIAAGPFGLGYWEVASDGGIFSYGDAHFYGSTGSLVLNKPVVGMVADPATGGYWTVASDGGIFAFNAPFFGSTGSMHLNQPVVGMAATPDGGGYWLVAADGGIFSYGDAQFYGSTGSLVLNKPVIGMIAGPGGNGYFLVASDGGIFSFGSAPFYGSLGGQALKRPIVAATAIPDGSGYWFTDGAGLVSNFGAARYYGSAPPNLFRPIVGMADAPGNGTFAGGPYPSGAYGYDISKWQCGGMPPSPHQIGIVEVDGSSSSNTNPCLAQEVVWAGGGLNLYTYLTYGTSSTPEPGCLVSGGYDQACNAGYQAGLYAFNDAQAAGANASVSWWLDVESDPSWSGNTAENALFVQGAMNALHLTEGIANVGIYASPRVWNNIVGNYQPDVPYWMASWTGGGPSSCAGYSSFAATYRLPTGPLQIVQYNSATYDEDYAC